MADIHLFACAPVPAEGDSEGPTEVIVHIVFAMADVSADAGNASSPCCEANGA
jgi:hypothetical protein